MSEIFQLDIVTPEKKIFSDKDIVIVTVPGIEGDMGILYNHIPIITFLKAGRIQIETSIKKFSFFISDGVLEFSNNILTILASEIYEIQKIDSKIIKILQNKAQEKIGKKNSNDNEIFLANKFQEEVNLLSSFISNS